MRDQDFFLAIEHGQDTHKLTGRERVVGSRLFVCQVLEQRQEPASSVQVPKVGSGVFVRVLNKGRRQPSQCNHPEVASRVFVGAGTWAGPSFFQGRDRDVRSGVCVNGLTRTGPRLVQCSDQGVGIGVFDSGFSNYMTQPRSVQGMRCWFRST